MKNAVKHQTFRLVSQNFSGGEKTGGVGRGGEEGGGFEFSIIEIDFPVPLMSCRLKAFSPDILGKLSLLNARLK